MPMQKRWLLDGWLLKIVDLFQFRKYLTNSDSDYPFEIFKLSFNWSWLRNWKINYIFKNTWNADFN
jgi:hypothetical protein